MRLLILFVLLLAPISAFAVNPDEVLPDKTLETRARTISAELRCMVCQNQSIDDSNADLARDLRLLVRKRLLNGDTDQQVLDYIVSRYGEFVLLKPRLEWTTLLLWASPILLLGCSMVPVVVARSTRRRIPPHAKLTDDERSKLEKLLAEAGDRYAG
ncbi:cytochrome c-type biogenesis protein CcmH (plasmid) [Rhizobium sp. CB3090]|uniref:cytochrome c-type biogenesis protein n=1 Tax=Rhizobium sp. CB3090 TaxID=3039156 RepID=UPI0024B04C53|nr:cytochrome c-type biogenesis protein [Rhizobium sp. CB3090]WFU13437.1 cytochrome c-type biogenesis protein CcmH [Rhizobium sp. CB3090]